MNEKISVNFMIHYLKWTIFFQKEPDSSICEAFGKSTENAHHLKKQMRFLNKPESLRNH